MEPRELFDEVIENRSLIEGSLSKLKNKADEGYKRVDFRPVEIKKKVYLQLTYIYEKKVDHENVSYEEAASKLEELFRDRFRQANLFTIQNDFQLMVSKKGKLSVLKKKPSKKMGTIAHNRDKEYIFNEGEKIDFLIYLGIMDKNYNIKPTMYSKFRQINRYVEFIDDIYPQLDQDKTIKIIDFGSGKSYLTFATYYYLTRIKGRKVDIVGLDLKKDVIDFCNKVRNALNYQGLHFYCMDIKDYKSEEDIDMVITLHACNTATDMAIANGIQWNAKVIMTVPCCQKELFNQIENEAMEPILKHGFLRDKLSTLVTDSLRGLVLEIYGYETQIIEFIETEHTPKNNLIRSVRKGEQLNKKALEEYYRLKGEFKLGDIFIESYIDKDKIVFNR